MGGGGRGAVSTAIMILTRAILNFTEELQTKTYRVMQKELCLQ